MHCFYWIRWNIIFYYIIYFFKCLSLSKVTFLFVGRLLFEFVGFIICFNSFAIWFIFFFLSLIFIPLFIGGNICYYIFRFWLFWIFWLFCYYNYIEIFCLFYWIDGKYFFFLLPYYNFFIHNELFAYFWIQFEFLF